MEYKVYYLFRGYGNVKEYHAITFKSKENADAFIALMKSEGIEVTEFSGLGYIG